jgi:hypothetical protein
MDEGRKFDVLYTNIVDLEFGHLNFSYSLLFIPLEL